LELLEVDAAGGTVLVEDKRKGADRFYVPPSLLPIAPPPVLKSLKEEVEDLFLKSPEKLEVHQARHTQRS